MTRSRPVLGPAVATALVAALAWHAPAAAQGPCEDPAAEHVEPVPACGRTTVTGPRGATLRLHVAEETVLDLSTAGSPATFRNTVLRGDGPAQGFLLTDNVLPSDGGKYVYVWHLVRSLSRSVQDYAEGNFELRGSGMFVIPAGTYSLYIISDGNPVTLTLPFEGRTGAASYQASRVLLLDFRILDDRIPDPIGQNNVWSAGHAGTFRGPGFHAMTWSAVGELPDVAAAAGSCYYFGRPQNDNTAYLPGCPNSLTEDILANQVFQGGATADTPVQAFTSAFSGPGGRAIGWWRASAEPLERIAALSYFFELDPAFTPEPKPGT
ncbi:MAG TPA: hypothetical protein VG602_05440 [Actinomycetota bacterium]|nr:hypothetical protein [Actinomycetota bacterium]